jgi:hypothetical protein
MVVAWVVTLSLIIGVCAIYGGRNCTAPNRGPFAWLMKGEKFVPTHSRYGACKRVK